MPNLKKIIYKNKIRFENHPNEILLLSDNKKYIDAGEISKKEGVYVWKPPLNFDWLGHHILGSVAEELYRLNFPMKKSRHQIRKK